MPDQQFIQKPFDSVTQVGFHPGQLGQIQRDVWGLLLPGFPSLLWIRQW